MKIERFGDLIAWRKSKELALAVYRVTGAGAFSRDFGLRDQVQRAAVSVMSNIAEGFERYSRPEFKQFLSVARGSVAEVRSQLYLARELNYLSADQHTALHNLCLDVSRLLGALRSSLERA